MGEQEPKRVKKHICLGILAHVDAGKTTLSEAMLYQAGGIRKLGRVDNGDAFLDTDALEKERGITIFSKQAVFAYKDLQITLLDTPGHVDFSAEMERTLQVLDYAILVINGGDGVQGHTKTLWRLLKRYNIPCYLFINKMDQKGTDREKLLEDLKKQLDERCIDFENTASEIFSENLAMCDEELLEQFLDNGKIEQGEIKNKIINRKIFPCYFGSALKLWGIEELLEGIRKYAGIPAYPKEFGAKIFKITRDAQDNRLTHLKITGGILRVKDMLSEGREKVNQIRIYSGEKFEAVSEAEAGSICAVTGPVKTFPGQGLGKEDDSQLPFLEPVLSYRLILPESCEAAAFLPKLKQLEEEEPELHIVWDENLKEIQAKVMGEVQTEILKHLIEQRSGVAVDFGEGNIVYKETITDRTEGVGHFEPLRHYAEVHLILEPGEPDSGLTFSTVCSEDMLGRNWQRLVLTHLEEKEHKGVLTGAPVTDMKITLAAGRAHLKHTEGGDFRQATYRALRQGLMEAASVLLEPFYDFLLELPEACAGRAMTDIERMQGSFTLEGSTKGMTALRGTAPVAAMRDYQREVTAYTRGLGRLFCTLKGYGPCHNAEEIIENTGYEPDRDLENPTGSVFCAHGAGFVVPWDKVKEYMHVESCFSKEKQWEKNEIFNEEEFLNRIQRGALQTGRSPENPKERWIGTEEIDAILEKSGGANQKRENKKKEGWRRGKRAAEGIPAVKRSYKQPEKLEKYLLVDGYNIIFAWEDLKELGEVNLDGARGKLLDILCNYQGIRGCHLIVVFDAYRLKGHPTEILDYHNIHVVYTKEAETADQYIEKFSHQNAGKYDITVATSDGLEQIIIRGQGCKLLSARDLKEETELAARQLKEEFLDRQPASKIYISDALLGRGQSLPSAPEDINDTD